MDHQLGLLAGTAKVLENKGAASRRRFENYLLGPTL